MLHISVGFAQIDSGIVRHVTKSSLEDFSDDFKPSHVDTVLSNFYYYGLDGRSDIAFLWGKGILKVMVIK